MEEAPSIEPRIWEGILKRNFPNPSNLGRNACMYMLYTYISKKLWAFEKKSLKRVFEAFETASFKLFTTASFIHFISLTTMPHPKYNVHLVYVPEFPQ